MTRRAYDDDDPRVARGAKLFTDFTGREPRTVTVLDKRNLRGVMPVEGDDVALKIGEVTGIMYQTVRDGKLEQYLHEFRKGSRPLFVVSHDGKQLFMLGGAYDFTERGIVDKRSRSS